MKPRLLAIGPFADSTKPEHLCRAAFTKLKGIQVDAVTRAEINELRWQMQQADRLPLETAEKSAAFNDAVEGIWLGLEERVLELLPPFCDLIEVAGKMEIVPDWNTIDELSGPIIADGCHTLGLKGPQWALCRAPFTEQYTLRQRIARGHSFAWREIWTATRPAKPVTG